MAKQLQLRRGTTAQHATFVGAAGEITVDTTKNQLRVHDGTTPGGHSAGPGAVGSLGNEAFFENDITVTASYTITSGKNAMSAGPITVAEGVIVTVPSGSVWTIV